MATSTEILPKPASKLGSWSAWVTVALVAVFAGLMLPQLTPGEPIIDRSRSKVEAKTKSATEYTAPALPDMPTPQAMLVRLFAGTIFVLGLCVASLWGVRKWMQTHGPAATSSREMRLVESLHLGNRCSVHLVRMGQRDILIGADGGGIKTVVPLASSFEDVLGDEAGVRGQESGVRSQESGVRDQESGVRDQESGVRNQESGVRNQELGVRNHGAGVSGRGSDAGGQVASE